MNDIVMARTSLFRQPASQPASPPAFANLITSFFLRKTWLINNHTISVTRRATGLDLVSPELHFIALVELHISLGLPGSADCAPALWYLLLD
ncbi:hypothetical protein DPMN_077570 [Dreissena polymorpha]|uniref:Uncharacterized protein n=1 Tax=Dreissena polymorpha TaxID=45954 RepID=A0A9D3YM66_DREPO|nr:hypothetical protein DPMN_077570 [Dreissena polymorpha]